jgi:hypothetical protein
LGEKRRANREQQTSRHYSKGAFIMDYYEDYRQANHREPSYEEMKEEVKRLQDEIRQDEDAAREQIREIRVALGEEKEPQPTKPVKTCGHLRENGRFCGSIAVSGRDYCCFHLRDRGRRLKMARARARHQRLSLHLPPLEDLYAVQVGLIQVLDALLNGKLDRHLGGLALYGLQQAATNLCRPREVWEESNHFHSREQMQLPGFEAEFELPQGLDVNTPPEVAFPETQTETAAVSEERANLMEVTPVDIELMEIRQREGPEAAWRRLKQLDEAEQRRYKKAQAQLAHARHVVRAAAQNAAREATFVEKSQAAVAAAETEEQASAPPASVADRVGIEPTRKKPQSAAAEVKPAKLG